MKILIVDDHPLVRRGLRQTLESDPSISQVWEAADGAKALDLLRAGTYDLVVIDINLPDQSGLEVIKVLRSFHLTLPVLVLSMHPEVSIASRAIKAGACGYVSKGDPPEVLLQAIRKLGSGGKFFSTELMYKLLNEGREQGLLPPHEKLSDREYQVLCLLARGKTITGIAGDLDLSPNTVSTYRARILEKLAAETNADLTRYAIEHEII